MRKNNAFVEITEIPSKSPQRELLVSLPNELLLMVCELLPRADVLTMRLICRRISVVASTIAFPVVTVWDRRGWKRVQQMLEIMSGKLHQVRSLLIHAKFPRRERGFDQHYLHRILTETHKIQHLSISQAYGDYPSFEVHPHLESFRCVPTLQHITHFEVIGISIQPIILQSMPNLDEVILNLSDHASDAKGLYSYRRVMEFAKALHSAPLRHLRISTTDLNLRLVHHLAHAFPKLETLYLVCTTMDVLNVGAILIEDCTNHLDLLLAALSPFKQLRNLFLPAFFGFSFHEHMSGYRRYIDTRDQTMYGVINDDITREACNCLHEKFPSLEFCGWLGPDVHAKSGWASMCTSTLRPMGFVAVKVDDEVKWEVRKDSDDWPGTGLDDAFSIL